jgi:hypothetical protein
MDPARVGTSPLRGHRSKDRVDTPPPLVGYWFRSANNPMAGRVRQAAKGAAGPHPGFAGNGDQGRAHALGHRRGWVGVQAATKDAPWAPAQCQDYLRQAEAAAGVEKLEVVSGTPTGGSGRRNGRSCPSRMWPRQVAGRT